MTKTKVCTFRARRRSAAERRVLLPLQREIGAVDRVSRRKYVQDFNRAYRTYERVIGKEELLRFCADADTLLVSDFHALDSCQFFLCELLEQLAEVQTRPLALLLESVFTRDQHILDQWQANAISDGELHHRLRFALDWGYEWEPFLHTLKIARGLGIPIFGADCAPRGNIRRIAGRDRHAADTLKCVREKLPESLLVVFFGESHMAPAHLPSEIRQRLPEECVRLVLQNVDHLYFRAAGELHDRVEALRVNGDAVAVFNATPVEKWQSYRLCIERWREELRRGPDLTPLLYDLIDGLLDFLHIDRYAEEGEHSRYFVDCYPEVLNVDSLDQAKSILERNGLCEERCRHVAASLVEQGSCYVPELNLLLAHRLRMISATREVARFVHHACRNFEATTAASAADPDPEDSFYALALENALMEFGSRILYPSQPRMEDNTLLSLYAEEPDDWPAMTVSAREHTRVLDAVMLHRDYELYSGAYAAKPRLLEDIFLASRTTQELFGKYLGELLGNDLYRAYLEGRLSRSAARSLMFRKLNIGEARNLYFSIARRIRRRSRLLAA